MSDNNSAVPSLLVVGFASAMLLWYGNRKRRTIWHPMSTWWNKRQALLANSRLDQLLVITDFDATITMGDSIQCHDMLGFSELMSPPFRAAFAPLLDWASNPDTDGVQWCVRPRPPAPGRAWRARCAGARCCVDSSRRMGRPPRAERPHALCHPPVVWVSPSCTQLCFVLHVVCPLSACCSNLLTHFS
jgi:hypothetical protein